MIKLICSLLIFLFTIEFTIGQDTIPLLVMQLDVELVDCSNKLSRSVRQKFISSHKDVAFISSESNIHHLFLSSTVKSSNKLEGLDTYHYVELEVSVLLKNLLTGVSEELNLEGIGKSANECQAIQKAYYKALSSNKHKIKDLITKFHNESFTNNCQSFVNEAQIIKTQLKYRQALAMLHNAPVNTECIDSVQILLNEIQTEIAKQSCENEIHQLTLIVNTKDLNAIKRSVPRLLRIPPNAPCADEALALSKAMGELIEEDNRKVPEIIDRFNLYITNQNDAIWRQEYLQIGRR